VSDGTGTPFMERFCPRAAGATRPELHEILIEKPDRPV